jgi:exopolysaccharide biosynthesis protein
MLLKERRMRALPYMPVMSALALAVWCSFAQEAPPPQQKSVLEASYFQDRKPKVPWSINIVRVPRRSGSFEVHSVHGSGHAIGLGTLSDQVTGLGRELGTAVAAINGDFYLRQGAYMGDPRGLQVVEGEMFSAPSGGASFWIDAAGQPHTENTESLLRIRWPNGASTPIGLNEARRPDRIVLYTPSLGSSTHTRGGRELVLKQSEDSPWLPLRPGEVYVARVSQVREAGNTTLAPDTLVLSLGPALSATYSQVTNGATIQISTEAMPDLHGVKAAVSGGPVLVHDGKAARLQLPESDSFEVRSAFERHPRSAVGWNDDFFFLVEVDGRQGGLSIGMTLQELANYLVKLGCTEAMNLDGGGSATLWYSGQVRNSPCDGQERAVANALVVMRKPKVASEASSNAGASQ